MTASHSCLAAMLALSLLAPVDLQAAQGPATAAGERALERAHQKTPGRPRHKAEGGTRASTGGEAPPIVVSAPQVRPRPHGLELSALMDVARRTHPLLQGAQAQLEVARQGIATASAFPNPEVDVLAGHRRARVAGVPEGRQMEMGLMQRLEYPAQRSARRGAAQAAFEGAGAEYGVRLVDLISDLRLRYLTLLRRYAEEQNAAENLSLAQQVMRRVEVRVRTGEAPRYELIRAESELLDVQRRLQAATLRVEQSKAELQREVGPGLSAPFEVAGSIELQQEIRIPPMEAMQAELHADSPVLLRARSALQESRARAEHERTLRRPTLALRGGWNQDPEIRGASLGAVVSVPVFDRREGPIRAALAQVDQAEAAVMQYELFLDQSLQAAYRAFDVARSQVEALESGLLKSAESALRVAEAAYRHGERGILDYLDAQRVYRNLRNDLIAAQYELRAAVVEIDRLRGSNHSIQETHVEAVRP